MTMNIFVDEGKEMAVEKSVNKRKWKCEYLSTEEMTLLYVG